MRTKNSAACKLDEMKFLAKFSGFGNQSPEEIYQAFDFESREQAHAWTEDLIKQGKYRKQNAGQSYFLLPA